MALLIDSENRSSEAPPPQTAPLRSLFSGRMRRDDQCRAENDHMTAISKILLAEDDPRVRQSLADLLTAWGYEVETARDGVEALEKADVFDPALVISDLRMPRMGGAELVHELRVRHSASSVIIFSGMEMTENERAELREVRFLSKPLNPTLLRAAIAQRLEAGQ